MKKYLEDCLFKGSRMKKALLYIALFNILFSAMSLKKISNENNNSLQKEPNRNLQYALNSIYYSKAYPANDITGTGDKLKDVPYKVLCKILNCVSGCCVGEIDNMRCGTAANCKVYSDYSKLPGMIAAIVVPIGVFILLVAFCYYLMKYRKYKFSSALCMCLGCLFIITIPVVLYYLLCKKENSLTSKIINKSIHEDNILLVKDKDPEANTLKNEPEKLVINHNLHQKRHKELIIASSGSALEHSEHQSHQQYKKLSSEDIEHKQIIRIGQTDDLYDEKMKIRIPDPTFDDNFHNEKSNNSVRVNSIHHKLKDEEGFEPYEQNGQHHSFQEKYKEVEDDELKNRSRTERDLLIGVNVTNEHEDLLGMDEENPKDKNNDNENYEKDTQDLAIEGEEPNGEHTTPENGEVNQAENNYDNNNGEDNAVQDNGNGENGEANAVENNENNDNMESENGQEEQADEANNDNYDNMDEEQENGKNADTPREDAVADKQDDENINHEADKSHENAEGEAQENYEDQAEKVAGEINGEAVEPRVEANSQHENQQVENDENKEESPQE